MTAISCRPSNLASITTCCLLLVHFVESNAPAPNGSQHDCAMTHGKDKLRFLDSHVERLPALLYSFPGSGNTWVRLLIEYATGVFSGSVYDDLSLNVVKAHPPHIYKNRTHKEKLKCAKGGVPDFKKVVLLLRDPYAAIWSEYQRRMSRSHVHGINQSDFDRTSWIIAACQLSHRYLQMWTTDFEILKETMGKSNLHIVSYESLIEVKKRHEVLRGIVAFLGIGSESRPQLECAFRQSERSDVKRSISSSMVDMKSAYTKDLSCKMWATFGRYSSRYGYRPWQNFDCSGFSEPLADVRMLSIWKIPSDHALRLYGVDPRELRRGIAPTRREVILKPIVQSL